MSAMISMTYAHIIVRFNPATVSGARMPLITNRRTPYAFQAKLDARKARERGLAAMAGETYRDAPEAIHGDL